ncbi:S8 family serine peptidase [Anaerobacillus sp. HL2]|nr:S8 family serine peptidase [Anaerobacillus sp. HL2]
MAAPHVTGMLALLKQAQPSKTNEELRQLIRQYAIDLGVAGKDSLYGFGRIEFPSQIEIEKPILAAPQNIKVTKLNNTEINITWSHPTETIFIFIETVSS